MVDETEALGYTGSVGIILNNRTYKLPGSKVLQNPSIPAYQSSTAPEPCPISCYREGIHGRVRTNNFTAYLPFLIRALAL